jgi:hypothetical protein
MSGECDSSYAQERPFAILYLLNHVIEPLSSDFF